MARRNSEKHRQWIEHYKERRRQLEHARMARRRADPTLREVERQRNKRWGDKVAARRHTDPEFREKLRVEHLIGKRLRHLHKLRTMLSWHTRADCAGGERPCPLYDCRFHLADVVISDYLPAQSCVLDLADNRPLELTEIATLMGVSRQRIDQLLQRAIHKLRGYPITWPLRDAWHD